MAQLSSNTQHHNVRPLPQDWFHALAQETIDPLNSGYDAALPARLSQEYQNLKETLSALQSARAAQQDFYQDGDMQTVLQGFCQRLRDLLLVEDGRFYPQLHSGLHNHPVTAECVGELILDLTCEGRQLTDFLVSYHNGCSDQALWEKLPQALTEVSQRLEQRRLQGDEVLYPMYESLVEENGTSR